MKTNAIMDNKFGWGCLSVNLPQSNKEQHMVANVSLHTDIVSRTSLR